MTKLKTAALAMIAAVSLLASCASYNAYEKAKNAEQLKDWDTAVTEYEKALQIDTNNTRYKISLQRARREASREHFEKGKTLRATACGDTSTCPAQTVPSAANEQLRLMQMAATELELTVKLDPTNQYAAVELAKAVQFLQDAMQAANAHESIDEVKKRAAKANITKARPPQLNPASDEPISLSFPQETPVKDIYRALGNAFGINILFDQAVKDDRISIELHDVTAQQALERVMQAANHFYKVLDEKTIIVVPDNPQARRDYEDLVIQTFYLSNGDAEQVTNVVRTMIEARNVFPLKALNAITIRDTADKVRIAEKIIEANDKAKAEVVVAVELVQLDLQRLRDIGMTIQGPTAGTGTIIPNIPGVDDKGNAVMKPLTGGTGVTLDQLRLIEGGALTFNMPTVTYALAKSLTNAELLANPELRISEGEKATLHIGNRIPVPVSTFTAISTGTSPYQPVVSYQYQDVGIKVSMEPRVHHNREVTLKLTVEVSNQGPDAPGVAGQAPQPTFATRTIESTIRLKDGETNFLAGLIQSNKTEGETKTPFLGDLPIIGRLFTQNSQEETRTDLILTMTPHIIRIPDITEDDLAPMWVGTTNNLTFRGVTPRIESQTATDPFTNSNVSLYNRQQRPAPTNQEQQEPEPAPGTQPGFQPPPGSAPTDPFARPRPQSQEAPQSSLDPSGNTHPALNKLAAASTMSEEAALRLSPRIAPQPVTLTLKPGEQRLWTLVGMDLEGLSTDRISLRFDPHALDIQEVMFGPAMSIDAKTPPMVAIDSEHGVVKITSTDGKPLSFQSGGEILQLRVQGGLGGDTVLVVDTPVLKDSAGVPVIAAVEGGRAKVQ